MTCEVEKTPVIEIAKKQTTGEVKLTMLVQNEKNGEMKTKKGDVDTSHVPGKENRHTLVKQCSASYPFLDENNALQTNASLQKTLGAFPLLNFSQTSGLF